jgi:hypothetical protein
VDDAAIWAVAGSHGGSADAPARRLGQALSQDHRRAGRHHGGLLPPGLACPRAPAGSRPRVFQFHRAHRFALRRRRRHTPRRWGAGNATAEHPFPAFRGDNREPARHDRRLENAYVLAISLGAVFFGATTYIGNGPNFMVKAIADQQKVPIPGFLGFIFKYGLPCMGPTLLLIWLLFLRR